MITLNDILKKLTTAWRSSTKPEPPIKIAVEIRDLTTLLRPFIKPLSVSDSPNTENRNSLQQALNNLMDTLDEGMKNTQDDDIKSRFSALYNSFEFILMGIPDQMPHGTTSTAVLGIVVEYMQEHRGVFETASQNLINRANNNNGQDFPPNTLLDMADKLRRTNDKMTQFLSIYIPKLTATPPSPDNEPDNTPPKPEKATRPKFLGGVPRQ